MEFPCYDTIPTQEDKEVEEWLDVFYQQPNKVEKLKLWSTLNKNIPLLFKVHRHIRNEIIEIGMSQEVKGYLRENDKL